MIWNITDKSTVSRHSKKTLYKPAKHCIILSNQCILSMLICCIIESPAKSAEGFLQGISGIVFWGGFSCRARRCMG